MTGAQAAQIIGGLRDVPVLTISDIGGFTELGGIVQFYFEGGQLRFIVHVESAKRAPPPDRTSSRLLALARARNDGHDQSSSARRVRAILPIVMLVMSSSARAQSSLPDLSLEDLMKLDAGQVYGASDRLQPVTEAPASVSFITADEIKRYGYHTLADILRSVRGMYVTDDRNFSYIGTRGFGKPGDYNSRILLLVNEHRVNDNVFGQAEIGAEFGLDPAMFERVEIIRGPASSLYGDSAFFAVVNVITRTGASLVAAPSVSTGDRARWERMAGARFTVEGTSSGTASDVALSATDEHSNGVGQLYFPVFDTPATNNGIAQGLDGEGAKQFYGRLDFGGLTLTGAYGARVRDVPTASFGTLFNEHTPKEQTTDRHAPCRCAGMSRGRSATRASRFGELPLRSRFSPAVMARIRLRPTRTAAPW